MNHCLTTSMVALLTLAAHAQQIELKKGDHVVLLGNTLAERMQHHGWLESYVQAALPKHEIVFRNHGYCGDRIDHRPRNKGFIDPHAYLEISKADVILAFFGYNESYDDTPDEHRKKLAAWIDETRTHKYNGTSAPRIVLFAPISHEYHDNPNFPDGRANNERLIRYAAATAAAAAEKGVAYVDLYAASAKLYSEAETPLTLNGIHLTSAGNQLIAQHAARQLFGLEPTADAAKLGAIRTAVLDKNWHWFHRYRATDGNDVWGGRSGLKFVDNQSNKDVLWHELLMIDVMTSNRDARVWAVANGRLDHVVDDSNVPPPVRVTSNVGGGSPSSNAQKEGQTGYMRPEETLAQLELAPGMKGNVFASEEMFPELVNPVQMSVDPRGRLWVAAWPTYPKWEPLKPMNDSLLILPDEDRDGVADRAITFAKVANPTGFEFWNGGVLVVSAPDILFLKDTDGDDVADVRIRVMHGLDSADTHHTANNLVYGPGGNIYYQRGVFHVSNVESPWTKAQQHGNSAMYRFNPRTYEFAFHANNSPNPHGISFDSWGYHYATDGTGGQCYQVRPTAKGGFKMHKLLNKTVRPVSSSGILSSQHFPAESQGNFVLCNTIGFLGLKQYSLERGDDGVVWGTQADDLIKSPKDRNFRPTDFEIGDDGALYVSDWQNIIIGHMQHNVRDPSRDHEFGRVFRFTVEGRPLMEHVDVHGQSIVALFDLLTHPTDIIRYRARIELSERETARVVGALLGWISKWDPKDPKHAHHLLEALWMYQQHNVQNRELLDALLASPVSHARVAAERVKLFWDRDPREIVPGADEPVPEVAAERTPVAELTARGFGERELKLYELGANVFLRDGHCVTCHQRDGKGMAQLYPPLTPNQWTQGDDERLIKITLKGLWGQLKLDDFTYNSATNTTPPMTPFRSLLTDEEVAGVLTYVRNTFGNDSRPVLPETVKRVSDAIQARGIFYMVEQLMVEQPFEAGEQARNANPRK